MNTITKVVMSAIILSAIVINLNAQIIDEAYIFAKFSQDSNHTKDIESKISIKKTFDINPDSLIFLNAVGEVNYNFNKKEKLAKLNLKEIYYDAYYLNELFNLRAGKSIITFDFTKTYSILNFLSKSSNIDDIDDIELKKDSLYGFSFTINDIRLSDSNKSQSITLHTYTADNIFKKGIKHLRFLLEATQSGDNYYRSIFAYYDYTHQPAIALASSRTFYDSLTLNMSIKYTHIKKSSFFNKLSSVVELEYSPISSLLFGIGYINIGKNLKSKEDRLEKHKSFKSKKDAKDFYSDLTSRNYLSFYANYNPESINMEFTALWLKNIDDSSSRYTLSTTYKYDSFNFSLRGTIFSGDKDTEFGYLKNNAYSYKVSFLTSWLFN